MIIWVISDILPFKDINNHKVIIIFKILLNKVYIQILFIIFNVLIKKGIVSCFLSLLN